jgi:two-component system, OmpR family, response regulator CpxR
MSGPHDAASHGRGRSVLVVDDDEAIRETLRDVLSDEGYLVETAENGARALERLRAPSPAQRPGLVLLDLMMPVMSGWEVLDTLHSDDLLADIPVVVVSAMTVSGARACVAKPVDLRSLLELVDSYCLAP